MYRFLAGTGFAVMALFVAVALRLMESALCGLHMMAHVPTCSVVPPALYTVAFAAAFLGCTYSAYRFYRDFYKGDYYVDLAESGHL
jgi:hypothetical protein